ncbi:hypothetical protein BJY17_000270 [Agromyces hippuratus]|uniref:Uncharacterized protein n=1 Tax=Agromyces hippuratus TaxID=286438 RepID=A0A852WU77_9MICO|nr:hypothetical protein [Agromyces hippuratus]NYG19523.1 hypothetical protein [Agromyces hippuratus]
MTARPDRASSADAWLAPYAPGPVSPRRKEIVKRILSVLALGWAIWIAVSAIITVPGSFDGATGFMGYLITFGLAFAQIPSFVVGLVLLIVMRPRWPNIVTIAICVLLNPVVVMFVAMGVAASAY